MEQLTTLFGAFGVSSRSVGVERLHAIDTPRPYKEWPSGQKRGCDIPDKLLYQDERTKFLVHIINPPWCHDPVFFTESRFEEDHLKIDKIDKVTIDNVSLFVLGVFIGFQTK